MKQSTRLWSLALLAACVLCGTWGSSFVLVAGQTDPDPLPMAVQTVVVPKILPFVQDDIDGLTLAYCSAIGQHSCSYVMLLQQSQIPIDQLNSLSGNIGSGLQTRQGLAVLGSLDADAFVKRVDTVMEAAYQQHQRQRMKYANLEKSVTGRAILRDNNGTLPSTEVVIVNRHLRRTYEALKQSSPSTLAHQSVNIPPTNGLVDGSFSPLLVYGRAVVATLGLVPTEGTSASALAALITTHIDGIWKNIRKVNGLSDVTFSTVPDVMDYPGSCMNGVHDEDDETDVDCGRLEEQSLCAPCLGGMQCQLDSDCWSLNCTALVCVPPLGSSAFDLAPWKGGVGMLATLSAVIVTVATQLLF